jgi:hypothetical protein
MTVFRVLKAKPLPGLCVLMSETDISISVPNARAIFPIGP